MVNRIGLSCRRLFKPSKVNSYFLIVLTLFPVLGGLSCAFRKSNYLGGVLLRSGDPFAMGLSSLPTPSEGVLTLLLVNTALTISILKEIFRSVLHMFGLSPESVNGTPELSLADFEEPSLTEKFRSRIKPVRFGSAMGRLLTAEWHADCRVCLVRFDSNSVVNRLPCGHLFHKGCVERWLDYRKETCPLCRSHLLPEDDVAGVEVFPVW